MNSRIYLDNAATSYPKPEGVYRAVEDYQRRLGTAVGRGASRAAGEVRDGVERARQGVAALLGAEGPQRIIFTLNATDSLNLALHGLLHRGDHVVTSVWEHNSVLRPLRWLAERRAVRVTVVESERATAAVTAEAIAAALEPETRLVALTHASNVTGVLQPVAAVAQLCRARGILCLVDAAQTAGQVPLDLRQVPIDMLACAGHKGLLGPLGTGVLYIRPGVEEVLDTVRQGGTGTQSEEDRQPSRLPEKYEAGNLNAPGLLGLAAGVTWLHERGVAAVRAHELELLERLLAGLLEIPGLTLHGPPEAACRASAVSVSATGWDPQELAALLDESFGIEVRAGLHCAPRAHRALGTDRSGGTLRISPGPLTTLEEVDAVVAALRGVLG